MLVSQRKIEYKYIFLFEYFVVPTSVQNNKSKSKNQEAISLKLCFCLISGYVLLFLEDTIILNLFHTNLMINLLLIFNFSHNSLF